MKTATKIKIIMGIMCPIAAIISGNFQVKAIPVDTAPVDTARPNPVAKKAMTWVNLRTKIVQGKTYALVGSDNITNPYKGDTPISQSLPILCIKKANLPKPPFNLGTHKTPGGAWRATWSGGYIGLTAPVLGTQLTSLSVANSICAKTFKDTGYRMAEFHDGDPTLWSGWDFWGEVVAGNILPRNELRFWVSINDQPANPW